jgi:NTE family protein
MQRPDVLVLGAGGTIGAAWMSGVLAGIEATSDVDLGAVEHLVGTSAGAIVAADLLAGQEPRAPAGADGAMPARDANGASAADGGNGAAPVRDASPVGTRLADAARLGGALAGFAVSPLVPLALALARPGGARLRAAALARVATPSAALDGLRERIAGHGLHFDGRLRIVCVERASGRRVVFGAPGAPPASVAEAVQASASVPWTHRAARIGEREYVDGGVWSPTNLDVAPALRDTHVLCLAPTAGTLGGRPTHPAIRAATTAALTLETLTLRRRGARVQVIAPAPADDPAEHVRLTGYRQGLALGRAS